MSEPLCLIVDDEPAVRAFLGAILRSNGIQALEAKTAVDALRVLLQLGEEIDLLITDIQMPGDLDGVDLVYAVRKQFSDLPVVVISGDAEKAPIGFPFVRKPFKVDEILGAIDQA